jgi:SAM-dependent methyltransferase
MEHPGDDYVQHIRAYYDQRLAQYGPHVQSLYWASAGSQRARFKALLRIGDLHGRSVQDIGCGFGDLYGLIREQGIDSAYHGVDLNPNLVRIARERYPEASFSVANILDETYERRSDYLVGSGLMSSEQQPWQPVVERMLHRMYELAEVGFGFNMQSDWGRRYLGQIPEGVNYDPVYWIAFCRQRFSNRIAFLHDYLPHDFTVFVYK